MPRSPTGQIIVNRGTRGTTYAARFRVSGKRRYQTLDAATFSDAEEELRDILYRVKRGTWHPPEPTPPTVEAPAEEPTFHVFSSEWVAAREAEGLAAKRSSTFAGR